MEPSGILDQLTGGTVGDTTSEETGILIEYWGSNSLVRALNERLDLRTIFNNQSEDFIYSLGQDASERDLISYFQNRFSAVIGESGIVTLRVQAFRPEDAQAIADQMLALGLLRVNELNEEINRNTVQFARRVVEDSEQRVRQAQMSLTDFQERERLLDPQADSTAIRALIAELEGQLAQARAELAVHLGYLDESSPRIVQLRATVSSLQDQIDLEGQRLTGTDEAMAGMLGEFNRLSLEVELATEALASARVSQELAITEMQRQAVNMLVISAPHLADDAEYPERVINILLVSLCSLLVFAIVYLFGSAIRDHTF